MDFRKELRGLDEFIASTVEERKRIAQARREGVDPKAEKPREVYISACEAVARSFEQYGFEYLKNKFECRKSAGVFTYHICFGTSNTNTAGVSVNLTVFANVRSKTFKKWRGNYPFLVQSDHVAGGQIGNLQANSCWLSWNLADASERTQIIDDIIKTTEALVLPYLHHFDDLESLVTLLCEEEIPAMHSGPVEFLICFADHATARRAGANHLKKHPKLLELYKKEYDHLANVDIDSIEVNLETAGQLARISHMFKLGNLSTEDLR